MGKKDEILNTIFRRKAQRKRMRNFPNRSCLRRIESNRIWNSLRAFEQRYRWNLRVKAVLARVRGRVGHKARSRENLRMAFLEASPLGSRITSRIAVIISRGRGFECGGGGSVAESRTIQHTKRCRQPPPLPSYRRPTGKNLETSNFFAAKPALASFTFLKKLIKSKLHDLPRVIRFQITLEFFQNESLYFIFRFEKIKRQFLSTRVLYYIKSNERLDIDWKEEDTSFIFENNI